eukprot:TRINITY_DN64756_c0_g1_i1.p1 TRINITY_DN64756_c0_g1~~TRINITY_DN64756_c0_g1_i1.p1  ORF type:complete len:113 (+),score=29.79 TRINITY_DN64756_c0_g1_i1:37-375(+)
MACLAFALAAVTVLAAQADKAFLRGESRVQVDAFDTKEEACDFCETSFTKAGENAIAPGCVCFSHKEEGGEKFKSFCASQPSAVGYVRDLGGCTCKFHDLENLGKTSCLAIG